MIDEVTQEQSERTESATDSAGYGYSEVGGTEVLRPVTTRAAKPKAGEVQVALYHSGVNPTDVKSRQNRFHLEPGEGEVQVPHHDGAGVITAVGSAVENLHVGQRVWIHLAAYMRLAGTAQQFMTIAQRHASPLPDHASFEVGAALGIPFITAHRLLTLHQDAPLQLVPGALSGRAVLVAGGAGAVGNAAIQLAKWAGATVITTVSSPEKAALAKAAGADHVINYRREDVADRVRQMVPGGVDTVVEVSPSKNIDIDRAVLAVEGSLSIYADDGGTQFEATIQDLMWLNASVGFVIIYTLRDAHLDAAAAAITAALAEGAIGIGEEHGMPVHTFSLSDIAKAHEAVESSIVGKVQLEIKHSTDPANNH